MRCGGTLVIAACWAWLAVLPCAAGEGKSGEPAPCAAADLVQALVAGDEARAKECTEAMFAGKLEIREADLRDGRTVAYNIVLRASTKWHDLQLGVDTVADYVMCVLEIKNETDACLILDEVAPGQFPNCRIGEGREVCNSLVYPVGNDIKEHLRRYWSRRLGFSS